jgi:adenine deaminase
MDRSWLIAVARGDEPADLVLENARVVNVFTGDVERADVVLAEGCIAGVGDYASAPVREREDLQGAFLAPAYIDAHIHLESTMLLPSEFARAVLPHGSACAVCDPHEIANVMGLDGIKLLMKLAEDVPFDFYFTLSSCVPATHLETSGASLTAADLEQLIEHPRIVALAEMMNFPGVFMRFPEVLAKLEVAHRASKSVDGHAPMLRGRDLNAYIAGGISSDHECTALDEAREKLARGMWIFIREGSTEKNLADLLPLVNPTTAARCCFVTDDRHPEDLLELGHLNYNVHKAIGLGLDPVTAIRLATINPASYFGLRYRGAIAPGYVADIQVLSDLGDGLLKPHKVFKDGMLAAKDGVLALNITLPGSPESALRTVNIPRCFTAADFAVRGSSHVRVIQVIPGQIVTGSLTANVPVANGMLQSDAAHDNLKLAVVERHTGEMGRSVGFVHGFGLKRGALASSVAHDSHNLIAVGANDADMAAAMTALVEMQGGFAAALDGKVIARVPLPLAGLISLEGAHEVAAQNAALLKAAREELGCALENPFMALSFLALPVIPELKLTDKGLVDVAKFDFVPLQAED